MKRPEINITPVERAGRIILGGAAAIAGLALLASAGGALAVVLLALLVLAGLDLVVTGALGHCPLYHKLGHGLMMIACCIPMLVIAIVLVATGVAGFGFIVAAVMCTAIRASSPMVSNRSDSLTSSVLEGIDCRP